MLLKYATADVPPEPPPPRTTKLPTVELSESTDLFDNLNVLTMTSSSGDGVGAMGAAGDVGGDVGDVGATGPASGTPVSSSRPLGAEELGLGFGLILYRVLQSPASGIEGRLQQSIEVSPFPADRALVYVDGVGVGSILRPASRLNLKVRTVRTQYT